MSDDRLSLQLITIPSSDEAFRAQVMRSAALEPKTPEGLQQHLRDVFPRAFVRERELDGRAQAWYVYRDGRWTNPEGLVYTDQTGRYVDANQAATDLVGVTREELLNSPPNRFAFDPGEASDEQQAALRAQWDGTTPLVGEGGLRRGDGSAIRVTFAFEPTGSGFLLRLLPVDGPPDAPSTLFAIGDVMREWRAAEKTLAELRPDSQEWARVDSRIAILEERYKSLFKAAKPPT